MGMTTVRVRPGPTATTWLRSRLRDLQGSDPLAPVTVVVPSHHAGLHLRRTFAAGGYAAVRFTALARLAEMLGAPSLAAAGLAPVGAPVRAALIRRALRDGGTLGASADHTGVVDLVAALATELRRRPDPAADAEAVRGTGTPTGRAAFEAVAAYRRLLTAHHRYDEVDLLEAAAAAVRAGDAATVLRDVGAVVVHQPGRFDTPTARLLRALAERTSVEIGLPDLDELTPSTGLLGVETPIPVAGPASATPPASVVIAGDAIEEVGTAVRDALAAMEGDQAIPLHRNAIVYRDADTYASLLRDTLTGAGLPWASLDGRPLAGTVPARALLGLIRLRDEDFSRASVLGWLSGLPHDHGVLRDQARWDKLSREAGIVRGLTQWVERLGRLADERQRSLDSLDHADSDQNSGRRRHRERDRDDARRIVEHIQAIATLTAPPAERTWPAHVAWVHRLRDEILTLDHAWSDADVEASQLVGEIVDGLASSADFEPEVDTHAFLRALEDALQARRRPEGRIGGGVLVGPSVDLAGIDLDRVHVLGAVEGVFPAGMRVDPLLPGDPLDRRSEHEAEDRRSWLVALGSAPEAVISAPTLDVDGRPLYPSPWLLELLDDGAAHLPATAVRRGLAAHPRLRRLGEPPGGPPPVALSVAERREREALDAARDGGHVRSTGLAARGDLPLGRALLLTRARRSGELTEFDGNLAGAAGASEALSHGLSGRLQSATGVQRWATCPFHFLLDRVLSVSATDDIDDERWWQIDAAERGSLIHGILEEFFGEVAATGEPAPGATYTAAHVARMEAIARDHFADAEQRGVTGHRLVWRNEREAILSDLRYLLAVDARDRGEGGWVPRHFEKAFGGEGTPPPWGAVDVDVASGQTVSFRGYVDRVDVAPGRVRIIDYKTGRKIDGSITAGNRLDAGRRVQLAVYGLAVRRQEERETGRAPEAEALYWYTSTKGGFGKTGVTLTPELEAAFIEVVDTINTGVRAGCFPQVPGDFQDFRNRCENCLYCEYDAVCPSGRDVLAATKRASAAMAPFLRLGAGTDDAEPAPEDEP